MQRTVKLLEERRDVLERTAQCLLEKETLDEAELAGLVGPAGSPRVGLAAE
jgi:cell division protease FtsH